jgi:hypothetical protein
MTNELPMNSSYGGVSERHTATAFEGPQGEKKVEQLGKWQQKSNFGENE